MSRVLRTLCLALPLVLAFTGFFSSILADWWLENLAVFAALMVLVLVRKRIPLSDRSWLLLFVFLCFHEYGALYGYSNVPIGETAKSWLHTNRNHYDRLVHFLFGLLLTWPMTEFYLRLAGAPGRWSCALAGQTVMALSALYEIAEWCVATVVAPDIGAEFVGTQGDPWDSAEDMACALGGTVVTIVVASRLTCWRLHR